MLYIFNMDKYNVLKWAIGLFSTTKFNILINFCEIIGDTLPIMFDFGSVVELQSLNFQVGGSHAEVFSSKTEPKIAPTDVWKRAISCGDP